MSQSTILILLVIAIVVSIVLGNTKKVKINMGITALFFAYIIGCYIMKMSVSEVVGLWPTSTMFTMLTVTLYFGFAMDNGTLQVLSKKLVYLCRNCGWLIPIMLFVIIGFFAGIGVEPVSVTAMFAPFCYVIAQQAGMSPLLMVAIVSGGSLIGSNFTYSLGGAIIGGMLQSTPYANVAMSMHLKAWYAVAVFEIISFVICYIWFKGFKAAKNINIEKAGPFNSVQKKNLIIIAITTALLLLPPIIQAIAPNILTQTLAKYCTIPVLSIVGTFFCIALNLGDEREVLTKRVPWGVIILVCGVSVLMSVAAKAGMTDTIGKWVGSNIPKSLLGPTILLIAGVMSLFSSGLFVVIPMFLPMVASLAASSGVSPVILIACLIIGSSRTGMSPVSAGGGMCLAANPDKEYQARQFLPQLWMCLILWAVTIVLALIGVPGLFV